MSGSVQRNLIRPILAFVAALAGGACTSLLGLDFDERALEDAGVGDAVGVDSAGGADASSEKDGSESSVDRTWSRWPIAESFPANQTTTSGEIIADSVTGLMWPDTALDPVSFDGAPAACSALRLGDHDDWRVPTRIELLSLVNYLFIPAVSADLVEPTVDAWTSSTFAGDPSQGWFVSFINGGALGKAKTESLRLRCVRAGRIPTNPKNAPPDRFVVTDAVVLDTQTSLTWQKSPAVARTFAQASSYCATLTLNGASNFRLPEVHELHSIVDEHRANPALDTTFDSGGVVWSKTARASSADTVWTIDEFDGHTLIYGRTQTAVARCVR